MLRFTVRIHGDEEVIRALRKVPKDADDALKRQAKDIAETLKDRMWYAARRLGRQAPRAASTLKVVGEGVWPAIQASNTGRARGLLFGSVFGMKRHTGWYAYARYSRNTAHQFRPYIDYPGYWFFSTAEQQQPWIESQWQEAADEVVYRWSA